MSSRCRSTWPLEVALGIAGALLMAWAAYSIPPEWRLEALLLVAAAALMTPFSVRLNNPVRLPGAMVIEITVLLVAPPPVSILLAGCINLFTSWFFRRPLLRTFSNVGNLAISNALAAGALFLLINPWPQPISLPWHLPVIVLAILVRMLTNLVGLTAILHLEGQVLFWAHVRQSLVHELHGGGFTLRLLPVLMALAYPTAGWWVLLLGGLVQVAIRASLKRFETLIYRQTLVDGLTGLENRKAWEQYRVTIGPTTPNLLAVIDVNGLKATNDKYGHAQGDAILVDLAQRLRAASEGGRVFRMGGDEFAVVLPHRGLWSTSPDSLEQAVTDYSLHWKERGFPVSASIGIAEYPQEAPTVSDALSLADQRMYRAKALARE